MSAPDNLNQPAVENVEPGTFSRYRIQVAVTDLRVGMYVCALDRPWLESSFELQGFPIRSGEEIDELQACCQYVYVDKEKSAKGVMTRYEARQRRASTTVLEKGVGLRSRLAAFSRRFLVRRKKRPAVVVERSLAASETLFDDTRRLVRSMMNDVRLGATIDADHAKEAISECVDHILNNTDALLMLSNIKDKDSYTSEHCVNVAILSIMLGRRVGMPRHDLEQVGLAGLLHDVGKVLTPDEILKKPERLTDDEFLIMKMHPSQGRAILQNTAGLSRAIHAVAHAHHERLNGTGYPRGLSEDHLDPYSRIVAIADTFDAITSDRAYAKGRSNIEAFQILRAASGNQYDAELVSAFLEAIGVYPPGTAVQLRNGQFGVVARNNPQHKLRPLVLLLLDARQRPVRPKYLDLAKAESRYQVARVVRGDDYGIDVHLFRKRGFRDSLIG